VGGVRCASARTPGGRSAPPRRCFNAPARRRAMSRRQHLNFHHHVSHPSLSPNDPSHYHQTTPCIPQPSSLPSSNPISIPPFIYIPNLFINKLTFLLDADRVRHSQTHPLFRKIRRTAPYGARPCRANSHRRSSPHLVCTMHFDTSAFTMSRALLASVSPHRRLRANPSTVSGTTSGCLQGTHTPRVRST
jgi:hypothetical protein